MTHLETLKAFHAWRRGDDQRKIGDAGLTPKEIGDALDWAIRELNVPDWVTVGDGALHGAIEHWQSEALKEKSLRQHYQEQLGFLQTERARSGLALRAALRGECKSVDDPFYDVALLAFARAEVLEELKASEELVIKLGGMLTEIVNITKGQPPENKWHSTHDAADTVLALKTDRDELRDLLDAAEGDSGRSSERLKAIVIAHKESLQELKRLKASTKNEL